jgi:hypothetical protein
MARAGETARGHIFNTDLLVNADDREAARRAFPRLTHVLDHPELRRELSRFDRPANAAKRRGRVAGLLAIGLGMTALLIAAGQPSEPVWGFVAAICGLGSIAIGLFGALYAGAKRRWLLNRVMTERLRQFHFQTLVCRWPEIAVSLAGADAAAAFKAERERWFSRFMMPFPGQLDSELTDLLDDETADKCWLHPQPPAPDANADYLDELFADYLDELFAAYRELRIRHQLDYANYKLRSEQSILKWSPRLQDMIFSYATLICIVVIFLIHLIISFFIASKTKLPEPYGISVHVWVIWIAIIVLGLRALQEGLQPGREIERYRAYRAGVRAVRDRFDAAQSAAEKFEIMAEMERLSFDEYRNFLRSNDEARFVI